MVSFKKNLTREIIIISSAIIVFILFSVLLRLNINHQIEIISRLKSQRASMSQSVSELALLIKGWEVAREYKTELFDLVPKKDALVLFPKSVQAMAQAKGVTLNFSFGAEENAAPGKELGSINFTSTLDGKATDVLSFMKELENKYYAIRIEFIDFNRNADTDNFRVLLKGKLFFQ